MTCQARELREDCNCLRRKTIEYSQVMPQFRVCCCSVRVLAACRWVVVVFCGAVLFDVVRPGPLGMVKNR